MSRNRCVLLAGTLAALILAGCPAPPASDDGGGSPAAVVYPEERGSPVADDDGALTAALPVAERVPAAVDSTGDTAAAAPRDKPAPPPTLDSARLIGLDEGGAERLLGPPDVIMERKPATRWRYANQSCTLDLFFYHDLETRRLRILAYDVAASKPAAGGDDLTGCAAAIRTNHRDGSR